MNQAEIIREVTANVLTLMKAKDQETNEEYKPRICLNFTVTEDVQKNLQ